MFDSMLYNTGVLCKLPYLVGGLLAPGDPPRIIGR